MATKNRRISKAATGQPALESSKRVPDRQTGQPSFVLGEQYPITAYYVNPTYKLVFDRNRKASDQKTRIMITDLELPVDTSTLEHLEPFERFEPLNVPGPLI